MTHTYNIEVKDGKGDINVGTIFVGDRSRGSVGDFFGWRRFVSGVDFTNTLSHSGNFARVSTYVPDASDGQVEAPWPSTAAAAVRGIASMFPDGGDPIMDSIRVRINDTEAGGTLATIHADKGPSQPAIRDNPVVNTITMWNVKVVGMKNIAPFKVFLNYGDRWLRFLELVFTKIASTHHQYSHLGDD